MKKLIYSLTVLFVLGLSFNPAMAADKKAKKPSELTGENRIKFQQLVNRVEEIRSMDKSNMTKIERKALRSELKEMKEQARALSGGVYLSVGAIIIVILLLILIL